MSQISNQPRLTQQTNKKNKAGRNDDFTSKRPALLINGELYD